MGWQGFTENDEVIEGLVNEIVSLHHMMRTYRIWLTLCWTYATLVFLVLFTPH